MIHSDAPYSRSEVVGELSLAAETLKLRDGAGDNWAITWAGEDLQITAYDDGDGFSERRPRLSLGFARIVGDPGEHRGEDLVSDADTPEGGGPEGIKASGLLMVGEVLYMFVRNYRPTGDGDYAHSRLAWSRDQGAHWTWADWHFSDTFGCPEFVQFGQNYDGARDGYVYIASHADPSAYEFSPDIVLARVPVDQVAQRDSYEFYCGSGADGEAGWSADIAQRAPIFTDPLGTQRISITHNAALGRYFLTTSHRPPGSDATYTPAWGVFDAPEPWGPWTTVYYDHDWSEGARTYHYKFPTKWMSEDGKEMWLLFSGLDGGYYTFCLKKARLTPLTISNPAFAAEAPASAE